MDQEHLAKVWAALTDPQADLAAEQRAFCNFDNPEKPYEPPLKPWVKKLLGWDYIHLGRAAGQEADLYRELAFVLELLNLHVAADKLAPETQLELLGWLAEEHQEGPWEQLQALGPDSNAELQSLLMLLQRVQLFVPARLMQLLGVEVGGGDYGNGGEMGAA